MVLAQGEVSNPEKTDRLKALYTAVKQRNIPSMLVITKIETADKPLLNSSGTMREKGGPGQAKSTAVERPRDMGNLYRSAKAPPSPSSLYSARPTPASMVPARPVARARRSDSTFASLLQVLQLIETAEKSTGFAKVRGGARPLTPFAAAMRPRLAGGHLPHRQLHRSRHARARRGQDGASAAHARQGCQVCAGGAASE